jgi:hypothetical protein
MPTTLAQGGGLVRAGHLLSFSKIADDAQPVKPIAKRVGCCLRGQRDIGRVTSEDGPGQTKVWRLSLVD